MPEYVRRMRREDIDEVLEIDREGFPTEWPPPNFKRELENRMAHYIVACSAETLVSDADRPLPRETGLTRLTSGLRSVFGQLRPTEKERSAQGSEQITGFAGFWAMVDEAHITTIATRESFRRQGIGELLLQSVIDLAHRLKARTVTLEVRVSNSEAQALYTKYGFAEVGLRRGYYTDNREDAILMSTDAIGSAAFQAHLREVRKAYTARWGNDRYSLGN